MVVSVCILLFIHKIRAFTAAKAIVVLEDDFL